MVQSAILHATTVAAEGRGLLIMGRSGTGKSGLALQLMALGARLVADDRTVITVEEDALVARCPPALRGMIEARGIGILNAPAIDAARLALAVDLDLPEAGRLPPERHVTVLGHRLDLVHRQDTPHFPAALLNLLIYGRHR